MYLGFMVPSTALVVVYESLCIPRSLADLQGYRNKYWSCDSHMTLTLAEQLK